MELPVVRLLQNLEDPTLLPPFINDLELPEKSDVDEENRRFAFYLFCRAMVYVQEEGPAMEEDDEPMVIRVKGKEEDELNELYRHHKLIV